MRLTEEGYVLIGRKFAHILVAERALGKKLPKKAVVHHVNGVRHDNRNDNLVVCEDSMYHQLLHRRAAAYQATGNSCFLRCNICGTWDAPRFVKEQLKSGKYHEFFHVSCKNERQRTQKGSRRRYTREAFGY